MKIGCSVFRLRHETRNEYGSAMLDTEHLLLGILQSDPDAIGPFLPSKNH